MAQWAEHRRNSINQVALRLATDLLDVMQLRYVD